MSTETSGKEINPFVKLLLEMGPIVLFFHRLHAHEGKRLHNLRHRIRRFYPCDSWFCSFIDCDNWPALVPDGETIQNADRNACDGCPIWRHDCLAE